jgi:hypothetical protein
LSYRGLNAKARLFGRAFFLSISILAKWVELKCQLWRIYFSAAGGSFWDGYRFCREDFLALGA